MKLDEAKKLIDDLAGKKFGHVLKEDQMRDIIKNKGKSGQLLEITIGLNLSNTNLDFEDGELKTNKCDTTGKPLETMFITQISTMIDELLNSNDFYQSKLYKKMNNLLYVPISKVGDPCDWMFLPCVHVNLDEPKFHDLKLQLEKDYYSICTQLNEHIETSSDGFIHTSNGKYIQIRSKDSKPYHPIHSDIYNKEISNKNHAFYFKKEFMKYIVSVI
ncbi:MutH/Sau3AI family endonuclease [Clostridium botulinum]|uniref:MutH/Sau3AI family endonuclease n=1 Tax=Clostridium botulinum TaxID=1491 RepID=UPI000773C278|nr:MutH/Sau3AI family endonuclease [Clostridium botulinum]NFE94326.1 DNA mismatch repair protein MutH [Clostridium botulinum]NFL37860.1 DNA mismatch repair protein MutH [Clostridium botulinum]NFL64150.1 DNA mismatch repair protein MutH [Clostridium botulinum]NFN07718.1 DNA mismatch repair protein MutH [Clostridium botulinum]NFN23953.1 DNA mismatch repair protein MutH [Clostridium botulinum]